MKIKKIIILVFLVLLSFLTVSTSTSFESQTDETNISIQEEYINLNQNAMYNASSLRFEGSGGYIGGTASVVGGGALIALAYWAKPYFDNWLNSIFNNDISNYIVESSSLSIDDVLNHPDIKAGMKEFGWTREQLISWLNTMIDSTVENFLNDEENVIYLGSSYDKTNDYSKERKNEAHKYTFHVDDDIWRDLKMDCSGNYGMIWILNMAFLQMAILKKAKIVLVTPTKDFYDYSAKKANSFKNEINEEYVPFYGKELEYINKRGYCWDDYESAYVHTYRN